MSKLPVRYTPQLLALEGTQPSERRLQLLRAPLVADGAITVSARTAPFSSDIMMFVAEAGMSLLDVYQEVLKDLPKDLEVFLQYNKDYPAPDEWAEIILKPYDHIGICVVPGKGSGGKSVIGLVVALAVAVVAPYLGAALAATMGVTSAVGIAVVTAGVGFALSTTANLLMRALAPPAKANASGSPAADASTLFIQGATNKLQPYDPVPVILGKILFVPPLGAASYIETVGTDQYARQLFCWGMGKYNITLLSIAGTDLADYNNVQTEHHWNGDSNQTIGLYPNRVFENDLSIQLFNTDGYHSQTTQPNIDEFTIDITFPSGLCVVNAKGKKVLHDCHIAYQYRLTGSTGAWTTGMIDPSQATTAAYRQSIGPIVVPVNGQYDVQVWRADADSVSGGTTTILDASWWTALKSIQYGQPILIPGVSTTALRMQATNQLNGSVSQLQAVASLIAPDYDETSETWIERETNNNASLAIFVLQNSDMFTQPADAPNATPLPDDRIDWEAFEEWHAFCKAQGYSYNKPITTIVSTWDLFCEILAAGRAGPSFVDNKWSVVIDQEQNVYAQYFTPANTWGFSAVQTFPVVPHAWRIQFLNQNNNYLPDEMLVFADGYTAANATNIVGLTLPGVTDPAQIWKQGREHQAVIALRPTDFTFYADVEYLNSARGSLVAFAHDVVLAGLASGSVLVAESDGGDPANCIALYLSREVTMVAGQNYAIRIRSKDMSSVVYLLNNVPGSSQLVTLTTPILYEDAPEEYDMFMFGYAGEETIDLVIRDIVPDTDLSAKLTCVDAAPGIFTAGTGAIPTYTPQVSLPGEFLRPNAPVVVNVQSDESVQVINADGSISNRMIITLSNTNAGEIYPIVQLRQHGETNYTEPTSLSVSANKLVLDGLTSGEAYDILIYYRRPQQVGMSNAVSLPVTLNGVIFIGTSSDPDDVQNVAVITRGDTAYLSWDPVTVVDMDHYEIRFEPVIDGTAGWASGVPIASNVGKNITQYVTPAAVGTYMIKAFDRDGNPSANAGEAITNIASLTQTTFIASVSEDATWPGVKSGTTVLFGSLQLIDGMTSQGSYTYATTFDLGAVDTVVLNALFAVSGSNLGDLIDTWTDIDSRSDWDGADVSSYGIVLQIRTTQDNPGLLPTWTDWMPFTIGDYTARAFQFQLLLFSYQSGITPVVAACDITIQMTLRFQDDNDVAVPTAGTTVIYPTKFRDTPALGIAAKNMATGDYWLITAETASGFTIRFYNSTGTAVARTFSYIAKGYGQPQ